MTDLFLMKQKKSTKHSIFLFDHLGSHTDWTSEQHVQYKVSSMENITTCNIGHCWSSLDRFDAEKSISA